jgi:hypothetical protein
MAPQSSILEKVERPRMTLQLFILEDDERVDVAVG